MLDKILFCLVFTIVASSFSYREYAASRQDICLLRSGLACTLAADFCMLVIYNNIAGLALFICAQTLYFFRHTRANPKSALIAVAYIGVYAGLPKVSRLTAETRLAAVYACAMLASFASAFLNAHPLPNRAMILLGVFLFLMCDINVALYNIFREGWQKSVAQALIWVFYLPSQAILSHSGRLFHSPNQAPSG